MLSLPKNKRLASPADYRRVYQSQYWGNTRLYSFNAQPAAIPKLGVTVSKKVAKSAVTRNRIKRQIKEFYRHQQISLAPTELIITAKPACAASSDSERAAALQELWAKILKWRRWYERQP